MQNTNNNQSEEELLVSSRAYGCVTLVFSIIAGFYFVVMPVRAMLNQDASVWYSTEGVMIAILGSISGFLLLVLGPNRLERLMGRPTNLRITVTLIVIFGTIIGVYLAWEALIRSLGYG